MHNGGKWTEARFRGFITTALRAASRRWPPKYDSLKAAFTEQKLNKSTGRLAKHYKCNACKKEYPSKQIQIDHVVPIGKCGTWDEFISRLFCEQDNLQALCLTCHKKKTKQERVK